ncbi:hypothetical protein EBB79_10565 [Parasedimentitalea marina]|uniref:Uncharacterized protein n=1 Tax=Parasedimentitalea marina TaxID=2483033 RepID=A0A3T0N2M0_9RHOB|nr:hypothetical protein [Parasedimentitalea marina]AZV78276.1 hypothetical protein EBB79_10565 [Parasedimentitalea marina]
MKAVEAHPLAICRFRPDEGGTVSSSLRVGLAPLSGHMRSKAYVEVTQVAVPYKAIEKLLLDGQEDAGVTEMSRRRLLAGEGFGLEDQGQITKAANIHPRSVGGNKRVTKTARAAYLCAGNHLLKVAYFNATPAPHTETANLPALLTANVLERFNGVLEPERLVDGVVNLTGELPIKGIGTRIRDFDTVNSDSYKESGETAPRQVTGWQVGDGHGNNSVILEQDPDDLDFPLIRADLDGVGELTFRDMMASQKLDGLIQKFAQMIKADPVNGEEAVERALYGIKVDYDHNCQVLYRKVHELTAVHQRPMDGASINDVSAHFELNSAFTSLVPVSELGLQLVTIVSVKLLESLTHQPDPAQT